MIPPAESPLKALPEGVQWIDFRAATAEDYEIVNETDPQTRTPVKRIYLGTRHGAASGVIVEPAPGYAFRFNAGNGAYDIVKNLGHLEGANWVAEPETIHLTASFAVATDFDRDKVLKAIEDLRLLPGFVTSERS